MLDNKAYIFNVYHFYILLAIFSSLFCALQRSCFLFFILLKVTRFFLSTPLTQFFLKCDSFIKPNESGKASVALEYSRVMKHIWGLDRYVSISYCLLFTAVIYWSHCLFACSCTWKLHFTILCSFGTDFCSQML